MAEGPGAEGPRAIFENFDPPEATAIVQKGLKFKFPIYGVIFENVDPLEATAIVQKDLKCQCFHIWRHF